MPTPSPLPSLSGIEIGQGSSAYVSKWMALKGNATRILGAGVVISADLGGVRVLSLGLQPQPPRTVTMPRTVTIPPTNHDAQDVSSSKEGPKTDEPERTYCTAARGPCPDLLSCQGTGPCELRPAGTPSAYGSFNDQMHTAAFGCSLTHDGVVNTDTNGDLPVPRADRMDPVPSPVCETPTDTIGQQLASIDGWGVDWSGKYPPWAYNMNVACPCQE